MSGMFEKIKFSEFKASNTSAGAALKYLILAGMLLAIASCKIAVIVVEGGTVEAIDNPDCLEGSLCIVEVLDTSFSEQFTAVAKPGWAFSKWNAGDGFLCNETVGTTCTLSLTALSGNPLAEAFVASDAIFYLMPVFESTAGTPITDYIGADGKEWAQPALFIGFSWDQINSVCPAGVCAGILNGYLMDGWTWASVEDTNALINYFHGSSVIGPGPQLYVDTVQTTFADILADGWRLTNLGGENIAGWTREQSGPATAYQTRLKINRYDSSLSFPKDYQYGTFGGWFYRDL